jgi:hypothetical protein
MTTARLSGAGNTSKVVPKQHEIKGFAHAWTARSLGFESAQAGILRLQVKSISQKVTLPLRIQPKLLYIIFLVFAVSRIESCAQQVAPHVVPTPVGFLPGGTNSTDLTAPHPIQPSGLLKAAEMAGEIMSWNTTLREVRTFAWKMAIL